MTIEEFAAKHRLQTRHDELGDLIVRCRHGQIYLYSAHKLGVMFLMTSVGKWNNRRKACEKAGMQVVQDGDSEGTLLFDSEDRAQARTAIKMVGAYRKVELSPEQRQAKAERMARVNEARKLAVSHDEQG